MDPSKTPETDLSGFQEQGGYIDQETIDQLEEYDKKKKKEKKLDRRTISRRNRKIIDANRERLKNLPSDEEIQAEGDAKFEPTPEDLKPKTEEEKEAARKGLEEARKRMADKTFKPERDEDGFIKSIATNQIKNILTYGLPVKSTYSGLSQIGMPALKYLFLNDGRF